MSFVLWTISRFGTYSIDQAINAGLDLEMPGVNKLRTYEHVRRSIEANKLTVRTIKERAKKVLELIQKCAKEAPEVRDGNPL
jgi:beta-glucosidase